MLIESDTTFVMQWWMLNGNDLNNHAKISEIRFDTYVASYMSCQDDLLNLDNFYPLQIKQKIWKSIIKISFATAQISSRFYFIPFSQKSKQHKKLKYTKDDSIQTLSLMDHSVKIFYKVLWSIRLKFLELFAHNHFDWLFFFPLTIFHIYIQTSCNF